MTCPCRDPLVKIEPQPDGSSKVTCQSCGAVYYTNEAVDDPIRPPFPWRYFIAMVAVWLLVFLATATVCAQLIIWWRRGHP